MVCFVLDIVPCPFLTRTKLFMYPVLRWAYIGHSINICCLGHCLKISVREMWPLGYQEPAIPGVCYALVV